MQSIYIRVKTTSQIEALLERRSLNEQSAGQVCVLCPVSLPDHINYGDSGHLPGKAVHRQAGNESAGSGKKLTDRLRKQGYRLIADLPDIAREHYADKLKSLIAEASWADGVTVKNVDELGLLKSLDYHGLVIGDPFLYAYNSQAAQFYLEQFPDMMFISPDELTDAELEKLPFRDRIIYKAYGRQRVMFSAQSFEENYCGGDSAGASGRSPIRLRSAKGDRFIVQDEKAGYTTVFTADPVSMFDEPDALKWENIMTDLTTENRSETEAVITALIHPEKAFGLFQRTIRGHHYKGID